MSDEVGWEGRRERSEKVGGGGGGERGVPGEVSVVEVSGKAIGKQTTTT